MVLTSFGVGILVGGLTGLIGTVVGILIGLLIGYYASMEGFKRNKKQ